MFSLKVKAKIYQYTGIYLAKKEQDEYMLLQKDKHSVFIGLWQANNGLAGFSSKYRDKAVLHKLKNNYVRLFFYRVLNRIVIIYKQFRSDVGL